jgi:hypothetical protein
VKQGHLRFGSIARAQRFSDGHLRVGEEEKNKRERERERERDLRIDSVAALLGREKQAKLA